MFSSDDDVDDDDEEAHPCARKRQDQLRSTYNTQCNLCKKTKQFLTERKGCQGEDCNGAVDFRYVVKRPTETGLVMHPAANPLASRGDVSPRPQHVLLQVLSC